jgi:hypothetical protein
LTDSRATDWNRYYQSVPATAHLTRRYTTAALLDAIHRYATPAVPGSGLNILEIGGANSCFLRSILDGVRCAAYEVVDTNQYGLDLLAARIGPSDPVRLHNQNVLSLTLEQPADVVFSVGLVEHFDVPGTRAAVLAHFDVLRSGGIAIITFPTPTLLYRATRCSIELAGMWKFHDERPLTPPEVIPTIRERAEVLQERILWPLMLTQYLVVARKR